MGIAELATFDRSPYLEDAATETKFLACLVKSENAWMRVPQGFAEDAFFHDLNRVLWLAIDNLYSKGAVIDPVTLFDALPHEAQKELDKLDGWKYIDALKSMPIDPENIEREAQRLLELRTKRRVKDAGERISVLPEQEESVGEIRDKVELIVSEIEGGEENEVIPIGDGGFEYIEKKMANPKEVPGIPSGFNALDKALQGFQPGRLYVVGARKKTGKSVILLNWAKSMAVDHGIPILWISTEHSQHDEFSRLLSLTSQVYETSINNGTFSMVPAHVDQVSHAYERIKKSPFYFSEMPGFSIEQIKRLARKFVRVYGVQALFFDYIKAPSKQTSASEWQTIGELSFGLKALATKEEIPVITANQINREGANAWKAGEEIDTDYFAGSDRVAQSLSVGMVLRQPNAKESTDTQGRRVLSVVDNRHGNSNYKMMLNFEGGILQMQESHPIET